MSDIVLSIHKNYVRLHRDTGEIEWLLGDELVEIMHDRSGLKGEAFMGALESDASRQTRLDIGLRLFEGLLGGAPPGLWQELQDAADENCPLRVRIDIDSTELAVLPWELMRDRQRPLWLNSRVLLRRGRHAGSPGKTEEGDRMGPLRTLIVVCNPRDPDLLADQELAKIGAALTCLPGRVHTEVLDGPSLTELAAELALVRPHVLHFIGHGMRAVAGDPGGLHFNARQPGGATGEGQEKPPTPAWTLGPDEMHHLYDRWTPRLVVLNACRQAHAPAARFAGLIEVCLERRSAAVVAMQADIASPAAAEFSHVLYEDLARARSIDAALTKVRQRLQMREPDGPAWALPVLQCGMSDPTEVIRMDFGHAEPELTRLNGSGLFGDLAMFLGRAKERRTGWWDQRETGRPEQLLAITSAQRATGKTWLAKWCLLTCMLRGDDVTYANLSEYEGRGNAPVTLDWLAVLRALRDACTDRRQPDPMPPQEFAMFNRVVNRGRVGGEIWAQRLPTSDTDDGGPFLVDVDRHAETRKQEIFQAFLSTLRARIQARRRPHLLAIDNVDKTIESDFRTALLPHLLTPVQETRDEFPLRLLAVAPQSWPGFRHLQEVMPGEPVVLTDFQLYDYKRLAREFWERKVHSSTVPERWKFEMFEQVLDSYARAFQGGHQAVPVTVYQQMLDVLLSMAGMREAG
ncbi:CHAT domain-containing protein [Streptomyces sp. NPDC050703]|uniref:CHAT domain-containing protein n=1 Tax=Streptomyces sp. NPDC050703 TaxID=3157218 RepID=UPI00344A97DC